MPLPAAPNPDSPFFVSLMDHANPHLEGLRAATSRLNEDGKLPTATATAVKVHVAELQQLRVRFYDIAVLEGAEPQFQLFQLTAIEAFNDWTAAIERAGL
jgi:hypothetical protein